MDGKSKLITCIAVAALLWFYMFSPWTSGISSFWLNMSVSAVVLTLMAVNGTGGFHPVKMSCGETYMQLFIGILIASVLWGIFWLGDKLAGMMFSFARGQVDLVYGMKEGSSPVLIAALLLLLIGPAEEFFWRGFVQKRIASLIGATASMFLTALIYALVHVWSFNFMLVMAALVAGGVWGLIYRCRPSLLPALMVSHALWDAMVFVIFPI